MKCVDCPYHYKAEGDRFPHCHYPYDGTLAPCEVEDQEKETEDTDDD